MKTEFDNTKNEALNKADVSSCVFYNQMLKAFRHGIEFELLETDGEQDIVNANDKNLPFSEWFNKYFKKPITEDVLLEYGWTHVGITCLRNEFGIRNEANQFLKRILVENNTFRYIDSNKEIKYSYELEFL